MTEKPPPKRVDLAQFDSVEDAISKVEAARDYLSIAEEFIVPGDITMPMLFFGSMINRCESLHMAISREMRRANPHAVIPLMRAYAEGAAVLMYVYDHIDYIEALAERPDERRDKQPTRMGIGRLIARIGRNATGFKDAYDELSEFTHFGAPAMWAPYALSDDGTFSWSSLPRWKSDEQAMIAAALTLEVAEASHQLLENFGRRYLMRST